MAGKCCRARARRACDATLVSLVLPENAKSWRSEMSFTVPAILEAEIDELITHYPVKRSASLMLLHALQEHFGHISPEATQWVAKKLGLQPINVHELVTFYPMFRQQPRSEERRVGKECRS